jgi:hypothetical protein
MRNWFVALFAMFAPALAALVLPNVGEGRVLRDMVTNENFTLKLFTNNITPAETDTAGTYTEASGNGYAAKTLTNTVTGGTWVITEGAPSFVTYAQQTFVFTGALGNVYGYYVVGAVSGTLRWAERFTDGPYNIQNNGDEIKVTPRFEQA